jgi:hypothetical protein
MLESMSAEQFCEWQEFAKQEPFGFPAESNMLALLCAVVANSAPFNSGPPIMPEKFLWRPGRPRPDESPVEEVLSAQSHGPDLKQPIRE